MRTDKQSRGEGAVEVADKLGLSGPGARVGRGLPALLAVSSLGLLAACGGASQRDSFEEGRSKGEDSELTSITARSRAVKFDGVVYVDASSGDADIVAAVRAQSQTAFGALRTAQVGVNSRELKGVDPRTFVKTPVTVVGGGPGAGTKMLRVKYTYTDSAVVPVSMATRSALSLALLGRGYKSQIDRVLRECTDNDAEAREFQNSIWYVFNPSLSGCRSAMTAEQKKIDADKAKLRDPRTQVARSEVDRLYLPMTASFGADKTNNGASYPEYDRLYSGGVQPGRLVLGLVNGLLDHGHGDPGDDSGYSEWMTTLREVLKARPGMKLARVEPQEDLGSYTVGGRNVTGVTMNDIIAWKLDGASPPGGVDAREIQSQASRKIFRHWLTFELPMSVKIGGAAAKPVTLTLQTYFGADSDPTPHKRGIKTSDVFVYNGHSYIGYGPLDPSNFSASDFPSSYQILFIDGCVSYNYYEKDYFPLKPGGPKTLNLITNGLEAPSGQSGYALGRFFAALIDGKQESFKALLTAARDTDSLRVVDGELTNVYSPSRTPIVVSAR